MNSCAPFCTRFTNLNNDRKRQIDTLKVFNDNVSEITPNTEYSVEFVVAGNKLAMLIILGPDFPMEKPLLKITPSISHQFVNENSEITNAPGYVNFSVYSDLGRVVQAIIRELQRNPPSLKQKDSPISVLSRCKNYDFNEPSSSTEEYEQSFEVMSSVIGRLHKMSLEELKMLNEDEDSLDRFVRQLPHVQSLKQTVTDMINETENLEKANIDLLRKTEECKSEISEKHEELQKQKDLWKNLYDKSSKLAEIRAPINVKKRLKQTVTSTDAESESIAENFLESKITMDEFLTQYKEIRMKLHALKVREDRIDQLIAIEKEKTS